MKYKNIKNYSEEDFRRVTGIKKTTFDKMIETLNIAIPQLINTIPTMLKPVSDVIDR